MSAPDKIEPSEIFHGLELGEGMSLGSLGRALASSSGELMDEIARHVRRLVDLPADVYRVVVDTPDERRVRDHLQGAGSDVLVIVVPVTRAIVAAGDVLPGGPLVQPVLLGKVFGVHDYVQDRADALRALPELPASIAGEALDVHEFLRRHPARVRAATQALPPAASLHHLARLDFWKEASSEEWTATKARIDAHYEAVAKDEARAARDLPIFRAAYALAYYTLGHVDPVAGALAQLTPAGVTAYQRYASHRERFARIVARLREADLDVRVPDTVDEAQEAAPRSALSAPAQPADAPLSEPPSSLELGSTRAPPAAAAMRAPTLRAPAHRALADSAAIRGGLGEPSQAPLPGLAPRLQLSDPGLGDDPSLGAAPALGADPGLGNLPPPVTQARLPKEDLPTAPNPPAASFGLPAPARPADASAPRAPATLRALEMRNLEVELLPDLQAPPSAPGLPSKKKLFD